MNGGLLVKNSVASFIEDVVIGGTLVVNGGIVGITEGGRLVVKGKAVVG